MQSHCVIARSNPHTLHVATIPEISIRPNEAFGPEQESNCPTDYTLFQHYFRIRNSQGQPRSGELRTQKLKSHLMKTQSLNVLPFKPGVGQYIAIHATLTAREFFLAYFYPSSPVTCIFYKPLRLFLCWLWLTHGSCVGPQNKIGHPAGCQVPVLSARGI